MKKIFVAILCAITVLSFSGCFNRGPQFENIDTAQAVDPASVSQKDYKNDLNGLIGYFKALGYLPVQTDPTTMLSEVIGAKEGYRYIYTVNGSQTVIELYEFDTNNLDDNAKRVIADIKANSSFHLFDKEGVDKDVAYTAYLSDNGKFMMIYTDTSNNDANVTRSKDIQKALKEFYASSDTKQPEASESSNAEGSAEASQASEISQASA